jgi:hypothetical protein
MEDFTFSGEDEPVRMELQSQESMLERKLSSRVSGRRWSSPSVVLQRFASSDVDVEDVRVAVG